MGALARPDGAAVASLAARAAQGAGTDGWNGYSVLHTAASRVGALDVGFVPGCRRPQRRRRWRRPARSMWCSCWGPMRSKSRPAPSWFMSGRTAIGARTAPMSSFRARPIRRSPASTSTPKDACRWPGVPRSRRARRAKTGRSCARFRMCWGTSFRTTRSRNYARPCSRRIRICSAPIRLRRATPRISLRSRRAAAARTRRCSARPSTISISPIRSRARPSIMAECSVLAEGHTALTAAE